MNAQPVQRRAEEQPQRQPEIHPRHPVLMAMCLRRSRNRSVKKFVEKERVSARSRIQRARRGGPYSLGASKSRIQTLPHPVEHAPGFTQALDSGGCELDAASRLAAPLRGRIAHRGREESLLFEPAQRDVDRRGRYGPPGPSLDFIHDRHSVNVVPQMNDREKDHLLEFPECFAHSHRLQKASAAKTYNAAPGTSTVPSGLSVRRAVN